ncbi:MAG: hypothetical protein ACFE9S_04420 [Candidatus Hermodarchaeota archaeon]
MDIFKWIKEIENVYHELIDNAKTINLNDIEEFRENQRNKFEEYLKKKNDLVRNALVTLSQDVDSEIKVFNEKIDNALKNIEMNFQNNIQDLNKLIINELGLDF